MTTEQVEEDDDGMGAGGRGGDDDEDEEEDEGDIPAPTTEDVELWWVQLERLLLERAFGLHLQGLIVPISVAYALVLYVECRDTHGEAYIDHLQSFKLLPGRIGIRLNVAIPSSMMLIEPMQEGCIWRQVRGAALEVSRVESVGESTEKVSMAQQLYDDLDNLVFEVAPEIPTSTEDYIAARDLEDDKVCIDCAVNTSPGTSEVVILPFYFIPIICVC
ncbi:hypothetical protein Droror1_Dr00027195 [Drosera rotundifolia]